MEVALILISGLRGGLGLSARGVRERCGLALSFSAFDFNSLWKFGV